MTELGRPKSDRAKRRANTWYDVKVLLRELDNLLTKPVVWVVVLLPAAVVVITVILALRRVWL